MRAKSRLLEQECIKTQENACNHGGELHTTYAAIPPVSRVARDGQFGY